MELVYSTWNEVETHLDANKGIIIPLGSIEQHGPSGLIGTDSLCAEAIARRMASEGNILVGPTISFGVAPFNLAFPGTISVRSTTLMALITDYVRSLARQGFQHFYFLNGHGGNLGPLRAACQDLQAERSYADDASQTPIRFFFRSWWEFPSVDALRREFYGDGEGMHATPSEVALTQALFPEYVKAPPPTNVTRLSASYLREHAGDNHADANQHRLHFPDGRVGSESGLANPDQGMELLKAAVSDGMLEYERFVNNT